MGLFEDVRKRVVPIDGAIGTMCHERGLASSRPPEWYNITSPEIVKEIHTAYAEAGAQLLTTNTFGGNGIKLASWNLHDNLDEINAVAVRLAREVARTQLYVAGSMGPTGKLVEPLGELSFEDAYRSFADQVEVLQREGVDVILIETMGDLQEARAAVLAVRENSVLPVIASFTFEATSRTVSGDTPEAVAVVMEALGVDGIGVNCVGDLDLLVRVAARMADSTHLPLMVKPSAGTPQFLSGATVFPVTPEEIVKRVDELVESGANLIGGCCGTTPQHIALLSKSVSRKRPRRRIRKKIARLTSRSRVVEIDRHISVIGELINPTGRKRLREDLSKGQTGVSKNLAMMQSRAGADILDVNVAVPLTNEVSSMARVVKALSSTVETPLSIDSSDPEVIEQGLRLFPGKALLNSTTGEEEKLRTLLPLARKYGACVICLTMDEKGIPATAEGCLDIARRIVNAGKDEGVDRSDMIIDPLVLSAGAQPERVGETLRALTSIKKKLKMKTVLGISNVSYGLPDRSEMNAAFLSMAVASGVDLVIIDPLDERVSKSLSAASLLMRRSWRGEEVPGTNLKAPASLKDQLREAVLFGDGERAESAALELLESEDPQDILDRLVLPTLQEVGEKFSRREIYLPQLMVSSDAARKAISPIKKKLTATKPNIEKKGKLVFATVKGDLHDIGKNIVIAVLENYGYEVVDLGRDVSRERIIECAERENVDLICLSSLMTSTMGEMGQLTAELSRRNLHFKVLIGGAVVTGDYAASIGAWFGKDAQEAVKVVQQLMGER